MNPTQSKSKLVNRRREEAAQAQYYEKALLTSSSSDDSDFMESPFSSSAQVKQTQYLNSLKKKQQSSLALKRQTTFSQT